MPKGIKGFIKGNVEAKKKEVNVMASRMRERLTSFVEDNFNPILEAKKDLALGHYVMIARKWESKKEGHGKKTRFVRHRTGPFEIIRDEAVILELINSDGQGDNFHKIVLEKPDNQAQNYLIDQAMGRAKDSLEIEGGNVFNIDKAIIMQVGKTYGEKQITNGKYDGNGHSSI